MSKIVLFQTIQFRISTLFKCQTSSISSNSVYFKEFCFAKVQVQNQKQFYFKQFSLAYKNSSILNNSV